MATSFLVPRPSAPPGHHHLQHPVHHGAAGWRDRLAGACAPDRLRTRLEQKDLALAVDSRTDGPLDVLGAPQRPLNALAQACDLDHLAVGEAWRVLQIGWHLLRPDLAAFRIEAVSDVLG